MNATTYGQLVNGTIEYETIETPVTVTLVELNRAEGPTELCGLTVVKTLAEANTTLQMWAAGMTHDLGYDKVDFEVHFSNGNSYAGRFDMKSSHRSGVSLQQQMISSLEWVSENANYMGEEAAAQAAEALPFYKTL